MPRSSTFLIAVFACFCCLSFSAEGVTGARRALLRDKKFNVDEIFYGPADASIVASEMSPSSPSSPAAPATAPSPPPTAAAAKNSSKAASPAPAPVAAVDVVASPGDPAGKESASPFVAPADAAMASEPAPAPSAASSSSASGRRLAEFAAAAEAEAAALAPAAAASSSDQQPLAARLPPGFIAPSPGDSVASIEKGLRKQQGS